MSASHKPLEENDITLINKVQETPSLYDHRHADFRMHRKEEEWSRVANSLNISVADAKRRWTCLRDRYSRELKQMRLHPSSEFGRNDFFRQMDFLREFVRKRRERSRHENTPMSWLKSETHSQRLVKAQLESNALFEESDHNYDAQLDTQTTQSETYSVLVEDDGDGNESYTAKSEAPEQKVLPVSGAVMAMQQESSGTAITPTTAAQPDLNYMVCMPLPNVALQREPSQLAGTSKTEQMPPQEPTIAASSLHDEDDFFCKSVAAYLRQLSRRHKIKAKVEMYQVLEKYILLEDGIAATSTQNS
ncbi:uncharacterized protein LOC115624537 [Scaptodrosophila lebanonensis]|uniref:Uncharacterized protein LOC115624537 n=1 Tax=Drosophila lebanonensis TaxID=7225 RepID=A0A6J2TEC2_DROLE|nr:uncharacterized protein LOC115624537 [Scaptodrosophila lebanonensis]